MSFSDPNCIFCKIVSGEISGNRVGESPNFLAFLDANPRAPGHTLVIPKKHFVTFLDIPNKLAGEFHEVIKSVASDLLDKKKGDGFNLVMNNLPAADQLVPHAHIHVIPRSEGDGLKIVS